MEEVIKHIADEDEIKAFHVWISELCDPDSLIVQHCQEEKFAQVTEIVATVATKEVLDQKADGQRLIQSLASKYASLANFCQHDLSFKKQIKILGLPKTRRSVQR
jgi:hypothetical protein